MDLARELFFKKGTNQINIALSFYNLKKKTITTILSQIFPHEGHLLLNKDPPQPGIILLSLLGPLFVPMIQREEILNR